MKMKYKYIFLSSIYLMLCCMVSCDNAEPVSRERDEENGIRGEFKLKDRKDVGLSVKQQSLIDAQETFALECFNQLNSLEKGNFVFSPFSISLLMGMTANGMPADEREEMMSEWLKTTCSLEELNTFNQLLQSELLQLDNSATLDIYNSGWSDNQYSFKDEFASNIKDCYNARLSTLDLAAPNTLDEINNWVNSASGGLIPSIVDGNVQGPLLLSNATYFKGRWTIPFDKEETHNGSFINEDQSVSQVDMMHINAGSIFYFKAKECDAIRLTFGNEAFSLYVVMPKENWEEEALADILGATRRKNYKEKYYFDQNVSVSLPRFEVTSSLNDFTQAIKSEKLASQLRSEMSFKEALDPAIAVAPLFLQKTVFKIDEDGAEGASVSMSVLQGFDFNVENTRPDFQFDHPFIFMLEEQSTGTILLMGAIKNL